VTQNSHLFLKLTPPPPKVSSSTSTDPSFPRSLNALSLLHFTRFFSSIPASHIFYGQIVSSTRSLSSAGSRIDFR
jgi:hypothetical protein